MKVWGIQRLAWGVLAASLVATAAAAVEPGYPVPHQIGFQQPVTEVAEYIVWFHNWILMPIITLISLFVLGLIIYTVRRFDEKVNPIPSKTTHNTLIEVVWTIAPVIILVIIAVPSFKLLYYEAAIPKPDVKIRAIGKQWFWTYEYPASRFGFDSVILSDDDAKKAGEPRLLGVDHVVVVPVNKVIEVETTGADVIHSWSLPEMGVKMDAIPGRLNHTWFKATRTGTFYGQCSELCGAKHAFMPIEVKVVTDAEYAAWLAAAKKNTGVYSPIADAADTRLAAQ